MQVQNGLAVATPLRGHTLAQSLPEVLTNDCDTLPHLRKVGTPSAPCPSRVSRMPYMTYEHLRKSFRRLVQL